MSDDERSTSPSADRIQRAYLSLRPDVATGEPPYSVSEQKLMTFDPVASSDEPSASQESLVIYFPNLGVVASNGGFLEFASLRAPSGIGRGHCSPA
jgi:hypothetical protein